MQGMEMENNQILMKEKLGFLDILKAALTITCRNTNFIIFTLLTSLPLFCTMLFYEIILQQTLIQTSNLLTQQTTGFHFQHISYVDGSSWSYVTPTDTIKRVIQEMYDNYLLLGFLYLVPLHLLDLFNAIATVDMTTTIYAGEKPVSLKEMLRRPIIKTRFKGPLITSLYVLLLSSLSLLGLIWSATNFFLAGISFMMLLYGVAFIALLAKFLEWSAIWNMGIVISILEEKHGDIALGVSAYFSRGSRRRGLLLMLVFFVWKYGLRLLCFYLRWREGGSSVVVIASALLSLVCLGNVLKWVVCMVYFYDCKKRVLEKKVDVEEGIEAKTVNTDLA